MSATLYTVEKLDVGYKSISTENEINLANSNARILLEKLGLDPSFEDVPVESCEIDEIEDRATSLLEGEESEYIRSSCERIIGQVTEAKGKGATHWFFM